MNSIGIGDDVAFVKDWFCNSLYTTIKKGEIGRVLDKIETDHGHNLFIRLSSFDDRIIVPEDRNIVCII